MRVKAADLELVKSLVGRTVVAAEWYDKNPDREWDEHEVAELTFDDGRKVRFDAYGYDMSGVIVELVTE